MDALSSWIVTLFSISVKLNSCMFLYVIGPLDGPQKIGISKNPHSRLRSLQTGHPNKLFLNHSIEVPKDRVRLLERMIHQDLSHRRTNGEWFDLSPKEAEELLEFTIIRWLEDETLKSRLNRF